MPPCLATTALNFVQGAYGKRNKFYENGYDYNAADNSTGEVQFGFCQKRGSWQGCKSDQLL